MAETQILKPKQAINKRGRCRERRSSQTSTRNLQKLKRSRIETIMIEAPKTTPTMQRAAASERHSMLDEKRLSAEAASRNASRRWNGQTMGRGTRREVGKGRDEVGLNPNDGATHAFRTKPEWKMRRWHTAES